MKSAGIKKGKKPSKITFGSGSSAPVITQPRGAAKRASRKSRG